MTHGIARQNANFVVVQVVLVDAAEVAAVAQDEPAFTNLTVKPKFQQFERV